MINAIKSYLTILILLNSFFILKCQSQSSPSQFHHITTKNGLPSNIVNSIIKDIDGFMWFGTGNGLARYDGYSIKVFKIPYDSVTGSNNQTVIEVVEYDERYLLLGTSHHGLLIFDKILENFAFHSHSQYNTNTVSNNWVQSIIIDKQGLIWIGTNHGLNRFDFPKKQFKTYMQVPDNPENDKDHIRAVFEDSHGILWLGTAYGIYHFNRETAEFTKFDLRYEIPEGYFSKVVCFIEDKNEIIWIGSMWGLYRYDRVNDDIRAYNPWNDTIIELTGVVSDDNLSNIHVESILETNINGEHNIWIATQWGLNRYEPKSDKFTIYFPDKSDQNSISGNFSLDLFVDETGLLWVGMLSGVDVLNIQRNPFQQVKMPYPSSDYYFQSSSFLIDENDTLWVAGINEGVIQYDPDFRYVGNYAKWPLIYDTVSEYSQNMIGHIYLDSQKRMWVGYFGWGLALFDRISKTFTRVENHSNNKDFEIPYLVNCLTEDQTGKLWAGSINGLYYVNLKETDQFTVRKVLDTTLAKSEIICLYVDRYQNLFVSTLKDGLYFLAADKNETLNFSIIPFTMKNQNMIACSFVSSIYQDDQDNLWLGSDNGLLRYNYHTKSLITDSVFNENNKGLIMSIKGDESNNLWILHETHGLMRYGPYVSKKNKIRSFDTRDGLPFDDYNTTMANETILYQASDNRLLIGSSIGSGNGFIWFYPDSIKDNFITPQIALTDFKVNNEPYKLDSSITLKKHITLEYNQNFFSFEFSALNFLIPEKNQYAYYLEGFEEDWNYVGNIRTANYTGVPPGDYTFKVKGSNNDGYWNQTGNAIKVSILPPFWQTWWAYLVYILAFIAIFYSIIHYYVRRQNLIHRLQIEHLESEKLKELDRLKTRFFTNISHEFRTPLTLIMGPAEQLLKKEEKKSSKQTLSVILKNANRLRVLVNQLLSLSKLDSGKMELHIEELDAVSLIRGYVQSFESLANQNEIKLHFTSDNDPIIAWIDRQKLEQILYNLLSNAFKFTRKKDLIEVHLGINKNKIYLSVTDSGIGIPKEKLPNIFNRFYQVDDTQTRASEGSGIGLSLVKELVELHHGEIKVESERGSGTKFTVFLPRVKDFFKPSEITQNHKSITTDSFSLEMHNNTSEPENKIENDFNNENGLPIMLIVEDNLDMRKYIADIFKYEYQLLEAANGEEGLGEAINVIPDIIVSDIMMPEMDGQEFCSRIKTDERTSHIPVILLTARASKESRLEGLETGADDFITKPFDEDELRTRVRNLIEQRKRLSQKLEKKIRKSHSVFKFEFEDSGITSMDEQFLKKSMTILEENYFNPDFKVDDYSKAMAMSRIQLHRKIKALTDQTTSELIRNYRLNIAAELVKKKSATITEIAYDVGFNSPSYFTECFRKRFGMLPSEFQK